jgi:hypothetical protein
MNSGSTRLGGRIGRCVAISERGSSTFVVVICLLVGQVQIVVIGAHGCDGLVLQDCS